MKARTIVILLFLVSLAIKVPFALATTSFGVDESLYLATAKNFVETGDFGIKTEFEDFKFISPVFPSIASVFYLLGGQSGVLLIGPIFSSLAIFAFYLLGRHIVNEKVGIISALIGFSSSSLFIASSRPLTESVALFFFSLAVLSMYLALKGKKYKIWAFVLPVLFVLTFLSRFQYGGLLLVFFVAYLIISRSYRNLASYSFLYGVITSLIIASPWLLFNLENYGSLLGAPTSQASTDLGFSPSVALLYFPYLFVILGTAAPFVLYGFRKIWRQRNLLLILGFFGIFALQFLVFGKFAEERYLLPMLPASAVIGAIGFVELRKKYGKITDHVFVFLVLAGLAIGMLGTDYLHSYPRYNDTKEAVEFMEENCSSPVMSNSRTHVWYYSGFENIPVQSTDTQSLNLVKERGIDCILFSGYEFPFNDYFQISDGVDRIFKNNGVAIYKVL